MKKFLIVLCILVMIPLYSFAANSPTIESTISCNPIIEFKLADQLSEWPEILKRLEQVKDETKGFVLFEVVKVFLDKRYETIEWILPIKVVAEHEPFVLIIDSEAIVKQETSITENGSIIIDFTEYEPGTYYICFYIKGA